VDYAGPVPLQTRSATRIFSAWSIREQGEERAARKRARNQMAAALICCSYGGCAAIAEVRPRRSKTKKPKATPVLRPSLFSRLPMNARPPPGGLHLGRRTGREGCHSRYSSDLPTATSEPKGNHWMVLGGLIRRYS